MRVARLASTPVKSLAVHTPTFIDLTAGGVKGDRLFYLVDEAGEIVNSTAVGDLLRYRAEFDVASAVLAVYGPEGLVASGEVEDGASLETSFYGLRSVAGHVVVGWDEVFTEIASTPVRLVRGTTGGFDVAGVTLLGSSALEALAASSNAEQVDPRRFRMNIEISGSDVLSEDSWEGRDLRVGSAVVAVGGPVKRCVTTTRDPAGIDGCSLVSPRTWVS